MSTQDNEKADHDNKRKIPRQTVILKSRIDVGEYFFDTITYDLSLYGARIKLNLPLEVDAKLMIQLKDKQSVASRVVWVKDGFIGLEFNYSPAEVKRIFGSLGEKLT